MSNPSVTRENVDKDCNDSSKNLLHGQLSLLLSPSPHLSLTHTFGVGTWKKESLHNLLVDTNSMAKAIPKRANTKQDSFIHIILSKTRTVSSIMSTQTHIPFRS
uniref:Uncharacterized protein n=1 Tax=Rhizophora mucronata TaxID=61149 RepID=A0A2P2Q6I2_RHIMU